MKEKTKSYTDLSLDEKYSNFLENIHPWFEEDIKVENILLEYNFAALLVEIGSCLGLWLGKAYK